MEALREEVIKEYRSKKEYIKELGKTIVAYHPNIVDVRLDIFIDANGCKREYLVVKYKGGAIAVRDCGANSNYANYVELGKLINGGYYSEVDYYNELKDKGYMPIE